MKNGDRALTNDERQKEFGKRIKLAREALNLTQKDLATMLGKSVETISNYEIGRRSPQVVELPALADALEVTINFFFPSMDQHINEVINRIAALNDQDQLRVTFLLYVLLRYLEGDKSELRIQSVLTVLFTNVFNIWDVEKAKNIIPDWYK